MNVEAAFFAVRASTIAVGKEKRIGTEKALRRKRVS